MGSYSPENAGNRLRGSEKWYKWIGGGIPPKNTLLKIEKIGSETNLSLKQTWTFARGWKSNGWRERVPSKTRSTVCWREGESINNGNPTPSTKRENKH